MGNKKIDHFYKRIQGWFHFEAVYQRAVAGARDGARFVEIGCWKGKSTAFMATEIANSGKKIEFFAVDHFLGIGPNQEADPAVVAGTLFELFKKNLRPVADYVIPMRMTSVEASKWIADDSVDFLLIDGGHDYNSVRADLDAWLPKMHDGATVAGDDWNWSGVNRAVTESFGENVEVLGDGKTRHWRAQWKR